MEIGACHPDSAFMCLVCHVPVAWRDIQLGKSECARSGHLMGEFRKKSSLPSEEQSLMKRARDKWIEFRKDKLKFLGTDI